ncbi:MAG: hypothetical protein A2Y18_02190 [Clostridiales bacterium GWD2_32_19]|nr:MAG: hypothetical protein A2Y18_02190 [Clostridiales bacterium GWD2_32_19]
MKEYVLAIIFDSEFKNVVMIKRNREPFMDMYNGVGGKIENGEKTEVAMIREIKEETRIVNDDIEKLEFMMKTEFTDQPSLNIFYAKLKDNYIKSEFQDISEGTISWVNIELGNLLDANNEKLAGDGNVSYFIKYVLNREGIKL